MQGSGGPLPEIGVLLRLLRAKQVPEAWECPSGFAPEWRGVVCHKQARDGLHIQNSGLFKQLQALHELERVDCRAVDSWVASDLRTLERPAWQRCLVPLCHQGETAPSFFQRLLLLQLPECKTGRCLFLLCLALSSLVLALSCLSNGFGALQCLFRWLFHTCKAMRSKHIQPVLT